MAVGILKYALPRSRFARLGDTPTADVEWPLGRPDGVTKLGDLGPEDDLVLFVNSRSLTADARGLSCRLSALIFEPPAINGRYYRYLAWRGARYHRVLTHNSRLLARLPNARFLPHGGCWLKDGPIDQPHQAKSALVSLIASAKKGVGGHRLRHRIAAWSRDAAPHLELLGKAYRPLEDKGEGHKPYYYSVVIENSREPGYFTEKLLDCLQCASVPIYWGAPDIAHFFDPRGMIVCHTEADLRHAILAAKEDDFAWRAPYLEANRRKALQYVDRLSNAARLLAGEDEFRLRAA